MYSRNFDTFSAPYSPVKEQIYSLFELYWRAKRWPLQDSAKVGADVGSLAADRIGAGIGLKWMIFPAE